MPSAIGLAGMGTVPGLVGWHAVNVTDGPGGAALASAIRGARANSVAAGGLQLALLNKLGGPGAQGMASPGSGASGSASVADVGPALHRRQAQRLDGLSASARTDAAEGATDAGKEADATDVGSAFRWRAADRVQAQPLQALRQQVGTALDALQDRFQAARSAHSEVRTAPLAVGYFQLDQDLTPDAALAVSLAAAASRLPRSAALADALGHMLSLSASTTPAMLSALRQVDDGGALEDVDVGHVVNADASAVTHRTLDRALRLLVEQQTHGAADRREPLREIRAAFAPTRIAPFEGSVRIGIARHWSGSIASVQTASSFAMTVAPSDASDRFLRNMLNQISHADIDVRPVPDGAAAGGASKRSAVSQARLLQMLDPAFVEEASHASIDIRDGLEQAASNGVETAAMSGAHTAAAATSMSTLLSRLLSLSGDDASVVQALSRRLHQGSMLAAASPVLAQYAVDDDPQMLLMPGNDGIGRIVMLADNPTFHVAIWADPSGGLCADTEVKWPITQYGDASTDPAPDRGQAPAPVSMATQTPTAPSWLQIRRVVHIGRDEGDDGGDAPGTRAAPVALTYGVSHLVCEIAHRMTFHAGSGRLA